MMGKKKDRCWWRSKTKEKVVDDGEKNESTTTIDEKEPVNLTVAD